MEMSDAVMKLVPHDLDGLVVLDVACAKGFLGYQIRTRRTGEPILLGLDLWLPYIREVLSFEESNAKIYDDVLLADARNMPFRDQVADIVLSPELLEHLSREDGRRVLDELERLSRGTVLASTPNQSIDQSELDQNPYQTHKSVWSEQDLRELGYDVGTIYPGGRAEKAGRGLFARLVPKKLGMIVAEKRAGP